MSARTDADASNEGADLASIVASYLADLETRARRESVLNARNTLERFVRDLPVVDARALMAWRQRRLLEGVSHKTVNNETSYLKAALALAVRLGMIPIHPLTGLRSLPAAARYQRRRPRAFTDDELTRILDAARAMDARSSYFPREPFLRALALTGCRYGELAQVTYGDFDAEQNMLCLRSETTKTETERVIPLDPELACLFESLKWQHQRVTGKWPGPGSRIFLAANGGPLPKTSCLVLRQLSAVLRRAGIAKRDELGRIASIHGFRHSFATRLARNGVPLATAQVLTGHKSAAVLLRIYTHLRASEARSAIEGLPRLGTVGNLNADHNGAPSRVHPAQSELGSE